MPGTSDLVSFTRASKAWAFDSAGLLKEYAVDERRFEYDPATLEPLGWLYEKQRTNRLLDNRDLSTGNWTTSGSPVIAKDATGLDGVANSAHTITDNDASASALIHQLITIADDTNTHIFSPFIAKDDDESRYPFIVNNIVGSGAPATSLILNTKTGAYTVRDGSESDVEVEDYGDWWRVVLRVTNTGAGFTQLQPQIFPARSTDGTGLTASATGSIIYDFGQVEFNADYATSPIETAGSIVTRSPDSDLSTIGEEFRDDAFTYLIHAVTGKDNVSTMYKLDDGTSSNRVLVRRSNAIVVNVTAASSGIEIQSGVNPGDDTEFKVAVRVAANDIAVSVNGGAVTTDTSIGQPTGLTNRRIGRDISAGSEWSGHILLVEEIPSALTDAELQSKSTL